jgi:hypothetical protein
MTHFSRSLIDEQPDTIARMAAHIRYTPNFFRTLNLPFLLATTSAQMAVAFVNRKGKYRT